MAFNLLQTNTNAIPNSLRRILHGIRSYFVQTSIGVLLAVLIENAPSTQPSGRPCVRGKSSNLGQRLAAGDILKRRKWIVNVDSFGVCCYVLLL